MEIEGDNVTGRVLTKRHHFTGIDLEVFRNEPRIDPRFMTLENVLLRLQHASGSTETRRAIGQPVRDDLAAHFAGQLLLTPWFKETEHG